MICDAVRARESAELPPYNPTPEEIATNVERGNEAMENVIVNHIDVIDAMERGDVGQISFFWGEPGKGEKLKGGWGISHLIAQRNAKGHNGEAIARQMAEVLAYGEVVARYGVGTLHERVDIAYEGFEAHLALFRFEDRQTWLITGYKQDRKSPSGATSERSDSTGAMLSETTSPRLEEGAEGVSGSIPQGGEVLFQGNNTVQSLRGEIAAVNKPIKKAADADELGRLEGVKVDLETQLAFELRVSVETGGSFESIHRRI